MMVDLIDMPLDERMKLQGLIVTDIKGGYDKKDRMITDIYGIQFGFISCKQCWILVKKLENETNKD